MTVLDAAAPAQDTALLEPMNLHNSAEFDELLRQRILCGWNNTPSAIEAWRKAADAGLKAMFWVIPPSAVHLPAPQRFGGHISLDSQTTPPDEELARLDKSLLHLSSLFILPEYRSGGLGGAAVRAIERWARVKPYGSPRCEAITIHTLCRRYHEDDGEEWRGMWKKMGMEPPERGRGNEDWYARMGYVKWKEEPRYEDSLLDGTKFLFVASFMRKELGAEAGLDDAP